MDRNSPWGMVVHSASEWDISELHKGGVAFLRIDFRWDTLQPTAGSAFQWLHFDRLVRWAADRGMFILAGLGGTPRWAVDPARMAADGNRYAPSAYPPADLAFWQNYVREVVARYHPRGVRYWGIWNEPDSFNEPVNVCFWRGSMEEFFDGVLTRAISVIRGSFGIDPRICVPDLAKADALPRPWGSHWLRDLLKKFGRSINAATVHVYRGTGDGSDVVDGAGVARGIVDNYNAANGTQIELWITETGWHRSQHTEAVISSKIQDLVSVVRRSPWVRKIFPYVWSDNFSDIFSFKSSVRTLRAQWTGYRNAIGAPQPAVPLERDSLLVSHNVPRQFSRGQTYNVQMTFRNTGRWAWPKQGTFRLGSASQVVQQGAPFQGIEEAGLGTLLSLLQTNRQSIITPSRVQIVDRAPVAGTPAQGETTISFTVKAPAEAGYHLIGWGLVDERQPTDTAPDSMFFGQGLLQRSLVS